MDRVILREVGLRDGLQNLKSFMATDAKKEWLKAEHAAGVDHFEVSSFVPSKLIPQLADAEEIIGYALTLSGLKVSALIPNVRGAERGIKLGVPRLNYVLSASESHNLANVRRTTAGSVEDFRRVVELCRGLPAGLRPVLAAGIATAFGCTIEGAVDEDRVRRLAAELVAAGADAIIVADTVGYGNPAAIARVFRAVIAEADKRSLTAHFHDTRGLGLANVQAALDVGVREFDASLGGLGGCPYAPGASGNIVMEDVVFLCEASGFRTGIDLDRLISVRQIVAKALPGSELLGSVAKAGLPKNFVSARL